MTHHSICQQCANDCKKFATDFWDMKSCDRRIERELFLENMLSYPMWFDDDNTKLVHFLVKRIRKLEKERRDTRFYHRFKTVKIADRDIQKILSSVVWNAPLHYTNYEQESILSGLKKSITKFIKWISNPPPTYEDWMTYEDYIKLCKTWEERNR